MPKKIDPAVKERALRMVAEHRGEYASLTACCDQVGRRLGLGKETVRRWAVQADIDAGARPASAPSVNGISIRPRTSWCCPGSRGFEVT